MTHVTFTDQRNNPATHLDRVERDRAELVVTYQSLSSSCPIVDSEGRTAEHDLIEA